MPSREGMAWVPSSMSGESFGNINQRNCTPDIQEQKIAEKEEGKVKDKVKDKVRWLMISAGLILGIGLIGSGALWGDEAGPPAAGAAADGQTVVAQADAAAPAAPTETQTTPAATPSATTTTPETGKVPVTEVTVKAPKEKPATGTVAEGYRVENTTTTGPWGEMKLQDTPYSIHVMSSELIENVQAGSREQLFKMDPLLQTFLGDNRAGANAAYLRGFVATEYEDGIRFNEYNLYTEDRERMEVFTGAAGFLYGPENIGGTINWITKRPTDTPLADITIGTYGWDQGYVHGDFGGPLDKEGKLGVRFNVVEEEGHTTVDDQKTKRELYSGAVDYHIADTALLQLNGSYVRAQGDGITPFWSFSTTHYTTPNVARDWGQDYTQYDNETYRGGAKFTWDIGDHFTFRSGFNYEELYSNEFIGVLNFVQPNNTYNQEIYDVAPYTVTQKGGYAFLDTKFETGPVQHKITAGFSGDYLREDDPPDIFASKTVDGLSLVSPTFVPEPTFVTGTKVLTIAYFTENRSSLIGDNIKFNDQWSALAGVAYEEILSKHYNTSDNALTSAYDKGATTPTASLMYKPVPWLTTYATYIEALEEGLIVPTGAQYTNSGEVFSPLISHQYEVGAKATVGGMLLTAALFDIEKANQFSVTNPNGTQTYTQDGREVHEGIEFTATGKVTDQLRLFGGLTFMECKVTSDRSDPAFDGNRPQNVANNMAKVYAEYDLPFLRGLTLTGGVYYTGNFYADAANRDKLPSVVLGDAGARYTTRIYGFPTIFRLDVTNVANKSYWIVGQYEGVPRSAALSMEVKFF